MSLTSICITDQFQVSECVEILELPITTKAIKPIKHSLLKIILMRSAEFSLPTMNQENETLRAINPR